MGGFILAEATVFLYLFICFFLFSIRLIVWDILEKRILFV